MTGPGSQEDGVPDAEEEASDGPDRVIHEAMFSFEAFEMASVVHQKKLLAP